VYKIEPLSKAHHREAFDCGSEPLNRFLKQTARQHAERGLSQTFVLVEDNAIPPKPILGFFALNLCQVESATLPLEYARKLPRESGAVRLGRLAVTITHQGQHLGARLLFDAMRRCAEIFRAAGGIGLLVEAKDEAAKRFYKRFGFESYPDEEWALFLPIKTIQEVLASVGLLPNSSS
jgi:ribosomal protein S18 acetylase RimI-like enzyme